MEDPEQHHPAKEKMLKILNGPGLSSEICEKFRQFATSKDQVNFIWNLAIIQNSFNPGENYTGKSIVKAKQCRVEGNKWFQKKDYFRALAQYSESVLQSPALDVADNQDEPALALALANRSATLLNIKKYRQSIIDIQLAMQYGYPEDLSYKLYDRKGKCYQGMFDTAQAVQAFRKAGELLKVAKLDDTGKQLWEKSLKKQIQQVETKHAQSLLDTLDTACNLSYPVPDISGSLNDKYPCASSAFEVCYNPVLGGRNMKAANDINVGDVLLVENPYSAVLLHKLFGSHCQNCLVQVAVPYPCHHCSTVVYCSSVCQKAAWKSFHHIECSIMNWCSKEWIGRIGYLALRTAIITGRDTIMNTFSSDIMDDKESNQNAGLNKEGVYANDIHSVYHLVGHSSKRNSEMKLQFVTMTMLLLKLLQQGGFWGDKNRSVDSYEINVVGSALIHLMEVIQCNAFSIVEMKAADDFRLCKPEDTGLGLYLTSALMNHSCDPAVDVNYFGNVSIYRAIRNIKAGEPVTLDYGPIFYTQPKSQRQASLQEQYFFTCQCEACQGDWPLWQNLESCSATFRCPSCAVNLIKQNIPNQPEFLCKHCNQEYILSKIIEELVNSQNKYKSAMVEALNGEYEKALPVLKQHLTKVQQSICRPWRDFSSVQAALKQCYRMMGNCSNKNKINNLTF